MIHFFAKLFRVGVHLLRFNSLLLKSMKIFPGIRKMILSPDRFEIAKLFRLSYAVHRYDALFRKTVPCRYIWISVLLCFSTAAACAQALQLRFTARFSHQFVQQYIQLDSIRVGNLTQGCDTVLYWPDTLLVLPWAGIPEQQLAERDFCFKQPFPQPFRDECTFELQLPVAGQVELSVYDQSGRKLHIFPDHLPAGTHSFRFCSGESQVFLVHAVCGLQSRVLRLVSAGGGKNRGCSLHYVGQTGHGPFLRSAVSTNSFFCFSPGDTLLYLGYASGYIAGFTGVPTTDTTFIFIFGEGHPCLQSPLLTFGGRIYQTVQIGTQCWMRENLNIGTMVISTAAGSAHSDCSNNGMIEKYCYNNDAAYCDVYGGLYDWDEMMGYTTAAGVQGICPPGWHIPTDTEWCTLTKYLDISVNCNDWNWSGTNAGGKMKVTGYTHWHAPNAGATNVSGFSAPGAGIRDYTGVFNMLLLDICFWSSSEYALTQGLYRELWCSYAEVGRYRLNKTSGFSVRCLRD